MLIKHDPFDDTPLVEGEIVEKHGRWILYSIVRADSKTDEREFVIERVTNHIQLYPGITTEDAKKYFKEVVDNDVNH